MLLSSALIEKFNPYHDRLGRFAEKGGFMASNYSGDRDRQAVTFSANPQTRAGAMAIARESDGEIGHEIIGGAYGTKAPAKRPQPKQTEKPKKEPKKKEPKKKEPKKKDPKEDKKPETEKPTEFTPAKTKKAATEYAKNELGFERVSYGTKLDIDTINHINEQITNIQNKYPETKGAVKELKTWTKNGVYAAIQTSGNGEMNFLVGTQQYGKGLDALKSSYKRDVDAGFHPPGTDHKSIIYHEYGHVLANISTKKKHGMAASETSSLPNPAFLVDRRSKKMEKDWVAEAAKSRGKSASDLMAGISRYGQMNAGEAFAEAFAEVTNSANPRADAVALVKASGWYRE